MLRMNNSAWRKTRIYSGAEIWQLVEAANKVSATDSRGPALTILQRRKA